MVESSRPRLGFRTSSDATVAAKVANLVVPGHSVLIPQTPLRVWHEFLSTVYALCFAVRAEVVVRARSTRVRDLNPSLNGEEEMLKRLWNDNGGAVISGELVLVLTILVIAMVTGLTSLRDAVVTELADVGAAIGSINQSFEYGGIKAHCAKVHGSQFRDAPDFCDQNDWHVRNSRCVEVCTGFDAER